MHEEDYLEFDFNDEKYLSGFRLPRDDPLYETYSSLKPEQKKIIMKTRRRKEHPVRLHLKKGMSYDFRRRLLTDLGSAKFVKLQQNITDLKPATSSQGRGRVIEDTIYKNIVKIDGCKTHNKVKAKSAIKEWASHSPTQTTTSTTMPRAGSSQFPVMTPPSSPESIPKSQSVIRNLLEKLDRERKEKYDRYKRSGKRIDEKTKESERASMRAAIQEAISRESSSESSDDDVPRVQRKRVDKISDDENWVDCESHRDHNSDTPSESEPEVVLNVNGIKKRVKPKINDKLSKRRRLRILEEEEDEFLGQIDIEGIVEKEKLNGLAQTCNVAFPSSIREHVDANLDVKQVESPELPKPEILKDSGKNDMSCTANCLNVKQETFDTMQKSTTATLVDESIECIDITEDDKHSDEKGELDLEPPVANAAEYPNLTIPKVILAGEFLDKSKFNRASAAACITAPEIISSYRRYPFEYWDQPTQSYFRDGSRFEHLKEQKAWFESNKDFDVLNDKKVLMSKFGNKVEVLIYQTEGDFKGQIINFDLATLQRLVIMSGPLLHKGARMVVEELRRSCKAKVNKIITPLGEEIRKGTEELNSLENNDKREHDLIIRLEHLRSLLAQQEMELENLKLRHATNVDMIDFNEKVVSVVSNETHFWRYDV
jgi:hypothetical protein